MPSQGSVQQHDMHQLRDESKDPPLVIAVSDSDVLDGVEPPSAVPPVPSSKPASRHYSVGRTKRKTLVEMTGNEGGVSGVAR